MIIIKPAVDIFDPKVIRSSMGAIFNIPVIQECDIVSLMLQMKQKQINTCAFSLDTDNVLSRFKFKNSTAIIIGNESNGINKDVLDIVDNKIKIDMWGKSQSLNAAVACSIAVYEVSKQLNGK